MSAVRGDVEIRVEIYQQFGGNPVHLRYTIGGDQARELRIGTPPPDFDVFGVSDWAMRRSRAESLAQHIAADLAHKLVNAFSEPRFSELLGSPQP